MQALYERYRPACWSEVVGQESAVKRLKGMAQRTGLAGRAYWLSGPSGSGKTTLARLIAAEVADDFGVTELDAQWLTPARLRELEDGSAMRGWGDKGGKVYVVNEAHGLSKAAIRQLLTMLEAIPPHVAWVFTTTSENQAALFEDCVDANPLLSRCARIQLADFETLSGQATVKAFAVRAREIAQREGLDGQPLARYESLAAKYKGNFRAMLMAVESGEML